ncbi:hypothetical protein HZB94_01730 [Candidatus Falkowbacteria bacterium]|nr:hypothetical protein [Candidatus Falkowbacteria bacterium]
MAFEQPKVNQKEQEAPKAEPTLEQRVAQPVVDIAQINKRDEELSAEAKQGLDQAIRDAGAQDRAKKDAKQKEYVAQMEALDETIMKLEQGVSGYFRKLLKLGAEYRDLIRKREEITRETYEELSTGPKEKTPEEKAAALRLKRQAAASLGAKQPKL